MSTGPRPIQAPEPIPKSAAKVIIAALLCAGSQRARMIMVEKRIMRVMMLKGPYLSARTLGSVLPMKLRFVRVPLTLATKQKQD